MTLHLGKISHLIFAAIAVMFFFSVTATAQIPTSGNAYFGYSFSNTSPLVRDGKRLNLNGWTGSVEGKVLPWVGIVADFSGEYGSSNGPCPGSLSGPQCPYIGSVHEQNFLFGPRLSVSVGKIRPFAEALFGAGRVSNINLGSNISFATAVGGGLDYRIIRPLAWRLQGDYVQTRFFGATQNNVRLSTGIVLRF